MLKAAVRVGPAGWVYKEWAGVVYPKKKPRGFQELQYLAEYFDTVEINSSFYGPSPPAHCKQWLEQIAANPRFLFTAKLWDKFTHAFDASPENERAVRAGFDVLHERGKLGAVLIQFPFSFHRGPENVAYLKRLLKRFADYPLVVEVRHATWNDPSFYALLAEREVGFCNIDQPIIGRSLEPSQETTGPIGYVRLHGRRYDTWFSDDPVANEERYDYLYSKEELEPWAKRTAEIMKEARNVHVVTNNCDMGKSVVNALELMNLLTGLKVSVPDTLRHRYPRLDKIASEPPKAPLLFPTA